MSQSSQRQALHIQLNATIKHCKSCKLCQRECAFLRQYGKPKSIAENFVFSDPDQSRRAFECSLCKLCTAVCPHKADPTTLFLTMRRYAAEQGWGHFPAHKKLLSFEKRGTSKHFTFYALPHNCTTILFPGCSLSASRSAVVKKLFTTLQEHHPQLGLVLDCCTKPSHDLGKHNDFLAYFTEMCSYLTENGVTTVLVACPSCYTVFSNYGNNLKTKTVYEELLNTPLSEPLLPAKAKNIFQSSSFHDSCTARFEKNIHKAVRDLALQTGINLTEMPHHGKTALCCGEGGGACFVQPTFIENWKRKRKQEREGAHILTYCAGCAHYIGHKQAAHVLDLLFSKELKEGRKPKIARAPFTYIHRLRLKRWAKKNIASRKTRVRTIIR